MGISTLGGALLLTCLLSIFVGLLAYSLIPLTRLSRSISSYSDQHKDALRLLSERARAAEDANASLRVILSSLADRLALLESDHERATFLREQLSLAQGRVIHLEDAVIALGDTRAHAALTRASGKTPTASDDDAASSGPSRWQLASGRYEPPTTTFPMPPQPEAEA